MRGSRFSYDTQKKVGVIVAYNTYIDDTSFRDALDEVVYGYFGISMDQPIMIEQADTLTDVKDLKPYEGTYIIGARPYKGKKKTAGFLATFNVKITKDGGIKSKAFDPSISGSYNQVKPNLFVKDQQDRMIYLKQNSDGSRYLIVNMTTPVQTMDKVSGLTVFCFTTLVIIVLLLSVIGLIIALIARIRKKRLDIVAKAIWGLILAIGVTVILWLFMGISQIYIVTVILAVVLIATILFLLGRMIQSRKSKKSVFYSIYSLAAVLTGVGTVVYLLVAEII